MVWDGNAAADDPVRGRLLPAQTSTSSSWRTGEYNRGSNQRIVGGAQAYARGITGAGVIVGVSDEPVAEGHAELQGQVLPALNLLRDPLPGEPDRSRHTAGFGHGTAVASVIAARRDGQGLQGIAHGARIQPYVTFDNTGGYPIRVNGVIDMLQHAMATGVGVINLSHGSIFEQPVEPDPDGNIRLDSARLAAFEQAIGTGMIFVWAAGNQGADNPGLAPRMPRLHPTLAPGWIAAVGLNPEGTALFGGSNRCGDAMNWCLAAPGQGVALAVDSTALVGTGVGTSFAAPMIAGAVALVKQAWPNLTADQVRQVLFLSADDLGEPGIDAVFGHGRLNIDRAFTPLGTPTVSGTAYALAGTSFDLGGALGDALSTSFTQADLQVTDSFARDFYVGFEAFGQDRQDISLDRLERSIRQLGGLTQGAMGAHGSYFGQTATDGSVALDGGLGLRLRFGGAVVTAAYTEGGRHLVDVAGLGSAIRAELPFADTGNPYLGLIDEGGALSYRHDLAGGWSASTTFTSAAHGERRGETGSASLGWDGAGLTLRMTTGITREAGSLLGSGMRGALATSTAETTFVSGSLGYAVNDRLDVGFSAGGGHTGASSGGLLAVSGLTTSAWAVGMTARGMFLQGDLVLGISQPLRVEDGTADLTLHDRDGIRTLTRGIEPTGREILLSLGASWSHDARNVSVGAALRRDPNHVAGRTSASVGLRYDARF